MIQLFLGWLLLQIKIKNISEFKGLKPRSFDDSLGIFTDY